MAKKTVKQLAAHYRKTGEYLPEAMKLESEYVRDNVDTWVKDWIVATLESTRRFNDWTTSFSNYMSIEIGSWQAANGFVRSGRNIDKALRNARRRRI